MTRVSVVLCAVFMLSASPAHADTDAFMNDLHNQGVPTSWPTIVQPIAAVQMCTALHNGATPQNIIDSFAPIQAQWAPVIVATAQRDVCPDTLH